MIRMGRSSKADDASNETSSLNEQPSTTAFPFEDENKNDMNKAISESESMARDIKDGRLSGFVGAGTVLTGETTFESMLRVDGHLTGRVISPEGTLIIGSTGQVDANIDVGTAMVNGTINGDVIANEKIELGRTARVVGNIQSPRLIVAEGAILEGGCSMVRSKETLESKLEEERKQYTTGGLSEIEEDAEASEESGETDEVIETAYDASDADFDEDDVDEDDNDVDEETVEAATI